MMENIEKADGFQRRRAGQLRRKMCLQNIGFKHRGWHSHTRPLEGSSANGYDGSILLVDGLRK
ncbi:vesicle-associated membrane protein [Musa troglodytarum]|uniref:Vesicle-associated membrane protein n=1 Tax=Musa troglodytarum TaxID=320322 RepID=A0A9E7KSC7_9LILI|nr:vesicle-associated membrane protein [Musa troglodytarum]